jgi:phospholipid transport system substrate-binding protein
MTPPIERTRRATASTVVVAAAIVAAAALAGNAFLMRAHAAEPPIATDTPVATIESLHHGLVAVARDQPNAALAERYRALEPLIEQTHDLPYIAEFALRRQWPALSESDRARFIAAFEKLSVTTYASRFGNVTAATFKMDDGAADGATPPEQARTQVRAAIARPGERDIPLEYLLEPKDGAWRIINIVADGVSDLALKRAEYQRVLTSGSIDDLIEYVDEQTAQLERR